MAENKKYWKGIEELEQTPEFVDSSKKEFAEYVPVDEFVGKQETDSSGTNRRDFLKVLGFSVTAATLAACEAPVTKSIPFLNKPEDLTPGVPNYYSSTYFDGFDFSSIKIKTREGRPILIEGNTTSPLTKGAVNARVNSSVLGLYDSKRAKGPARKIGSAWAKNLSWDVVDKNIKSELRSAVKDNGKVVLLSNTIISPAAQGAIDTFSGYIGAQGGDFEHVSYDAVSAAGILDANKKTFGKRVLPTYNFGKAKTIVSFGADFLNTWLDSLSYTKAYTSRRKPEGDWMSKHFQFETSLSLSGSAADIRGSLKPSQIGEAIKYVYNKLGGDVSASIENAGLKAKLDIAIKALKATRGESIVVAGSNNCGVQVLINAINEKLGNYASNIIDIEKEVYTRKGDDLAFKNLADQMNAGEINALIVVGLNASFVAPGSFKFNEGLLKVPTVIYTGERIDETGSGASYLAPSSHYLESWDVLNPAKGEYAFTQPVIGRLFKTRQWQESLLNWSGNTTSYEDFVKGTAKTFLGSESAWIDAVHDGFKSTAVAVVAQVTSEDNSNEDIVTSVITSSLITNAVKQATTKGNGLELELYVKTGMGNGDQAFNPWLHELPDPISKMTYDNYISMNPDDVMKLFKKENTKDSRRDFLYIGQESPAKLAKITVKGVSMTLPIVPQPGQAVGAVSIAVGYGRKGTELFTREEWLGDLYNPDDNLKNTIGQNVFPLTDFDRWTSNVITSDVKIDAVEGEYPMATTQTHHTMMGRKLVNETTLSTFINQRGNAKGKGSYNEQIIIADAYGEAKTTKELDLWAEHAIDLGHRWGLSIDLNLCIGCGSCVTACHIENNVAVVGKDEVRRSREMHWLRIDRYYSSTIEIDGEKLKVTDFDDLPNAFAAKQAYLDAEVSDSGDDVSVVYQPIMCQHCNHAPCETVCPVAATTHSNEGMNQMTYNRCVGTRYCANNCPYKVRRFNWFQYDDLNIPAFPDFAKVNFQQDDLGRMVLNPDVVVRSRGVMEKCSMCVQRVQTGKLQAKIDGTTVKDQAIQTACSSSCPTDGITFGDLNDKSHRISEDVDNERSYFLMEEVGTQPNVVYHTKVRNV